MQAEGHTPDSINLRFGPSRDSTPLAQLPKNQKVDVFGRKIVERPSQLDQPSSPPVKEAWYLVRAGARAGWVLGRFVSLDIPEPISAYAQSSNMVAWLVLNTVSTRTAKCLSILLPTVRATRMWISPTFVSSPGG